MFLEALDHARILPVLTVDNPSQAVHLVRALSTGGLNIVEVTLRTDCALEAISQIHRALPEVVVGAGSVMNSHDAVRAVEAGATFLVSPGFDAGAVAAATQLGVPMIPGVATATEMQAASNAGVKVVKIFPAELIGGLSFINALSSVWPHMRFVATGGITPANAGTYLRHPKVLAVGGSWMAPPEDLDQSNWGHITNIAAEAASLGRATS